MVLYRIFINFLSESHHLIQATQSSLLLIVVILFESPILAQSLFLDSVNNEIGKSGFNIGLDYTGEYISNIDAGINPKGIYLHNIGINMDINFDKLLGWENAQLHSFILGNQGGIPNNLVGSIQGISNIAAPNTWKFFEFWIEQNFWQNKISLLFGLFDLNSEFDTRVSSSIFINPSHGIGPDFSLTGQNGPSIFPTTSLAFRLLYNISDRISFKTAILDGVPGNTDNPNGTQISFNKNDGYLVTGELNYSENKEPIDKEFISYTLGGWFYTEDFEEFDASVNPSDTKNLTGNYGFYASFEKFLYSENKHNDEGIIGFIRLGFANNKVSPVSSYYGAGVNYKGLFSNREEEVLGLAIAVASNSQNFIASNENEQNKISDYEYIIELTYNLIILKYLNLQPDIQYVINPTFSQKNNFLVLGARISLFL